MQVLRPHTQSQVWHTRQAWGASAKAGGAHWELQWEALCSLAQPGPRQALGKRQEPD